MFKVRTRLAPSEIHGLGTFADETIARGSTIWAFDPGFDVEYSIDDLEDLPGFVRQRMMHFSYISKETGKGILCADDARFMNHSDRPNTEAGMDDRGYEVTVASRDIAAGEEITCDYYEFDADAARKLGAL